MALIIDAYWRRMLAIDETTLLHVTREGSRIVIEKSKCDKPAEIEPTIATSTTYDARLLAKLLRSLGAAGLDRERFRSISNDGENLFAVIGSVNIGHAVDAVTVARLVACSRKLDDNKPWAQAIEETLAEIPNVSGAAMLACR